MTGKQAGVEDLFEPITPLSVQHEVVDEVLIAKIGPALLCPLDLFSIVVVFFTRLTLITNHTSGSNVAF